MSGRISRWRRKQTRSAQSTIAFSAAIAAEQSEKRPLEKDGHPSSVMLGLVPSICLGSIGQQILGTRPRVTSRRESIDKRTARRMTGRCKYSE
ncbi:hypothetical protein CO659_10070 [Rhizobium sp. S9]|nr:hypothetical protein CO659_10070 [Rhizobium sp. S9]